MVDQSFKIGKKKFLSLTNSERDEIAENRRKNNGRPTALQTYGIKDPLEDE